MKTALLFPGQAAQFVGMGTKISSSSDAAQSMMTKADDILGYKLSEIMAEGPVEKLTETIYTQPAVYLHSMLVYEQHKRAAQPVAVAGHSLGEISACVAAGVMTFEDGLMLVRKRAEAMQRACVLNPSTMAAVLGMEDEKVEAICAGIDDVVPANYNCPGQLVISGSKEGISEAIEKCKEAGAKRALEIAVGGAFHSPYMQPAMDDFKQAILSVEMTDATIPIYQNVDTQPHTAAGEIRDNLISQVISPVRWTASINRMIADGTDNFIEVGGRGKILLGMLRKISREVGSELWQEE